MTPLSRLRERGFSADTDGDRLIVSPASRLTDDDRAYIRAHKLELMAAIARRRALAGDDWPEISADPRQLEAFTFAAHTVEQVQRGIIPDHYTATTDCRHCGPVPIFPGCSSKVDGCPWCFSRARR